jgi:cytochrome c-type biogenesis protein
MKKIFLFLIILILLVTSVSALEVNDYPALQKIRDYNNKSTADFAVKVSFLIAFIAGILGILSPCILPFIPAYFSYTFKEKTNITKMTFVFFLGFSLMFILMGVVAGFLGSQLLSVIQSGWLVTIAGIFIAGLGIMTLMGKSFSSFIKPHHKVKNDIPGVFLLGIFFAIGWSACLGPILAGILGIGAILNNVFYSAVLLFFYSLGNLVPLFLLSIFYDKFNLAKSKIIQGKVLHYKIDDDEYSIHTTNLVSGLLFLFVGIVIIIYKGTSVFNTWDFLNTKQYFYSVQDLLIEWQHADLLGIVILVVFVLIIGGFLWRRRKR